MRRVLENLLMMAALLVASPLVLLGIVARLAFSCLHCGWDLIGEMMAAADARRNAALSETKIPDDLSELDLD